MQPSRRKCIYKRSDNFKVILNQFFYSGKRVVPNDIMKMIRDEIHNETNVLYPYEIPLTIPILECILKRNELSMYNRGGQVHVKTVSHVCHRLEIPKPIQSLKKAGNL